MYVEDLLQPNLLPYQIDNVSSNIAGRTINFLKEDGDNVMPWSSRLPDSNLIEQVWEMMGIMLSSLHNLPQTITQSIHEVHIV